MEHKSFSLGEFKALDDAENGSFEAIVSVFGNVDAGGDRVMPGAFEKSLGEWKARGRSIPVLWQHDDGTVPIGVVTDAGETREGLKVKARLFVDDNAQSKAIHAAMRGGALQEFSFGYGARKFDYSMEGTKRIRNLRDLHLGEVSPVFAGMNPETRLLGVKSANLDLEKLQIDELKTLSDRVSAEIEQRQQKALSDAVSGGIGGKVGLGFQKTARPAENPPPEPTPVSEVDPPPPTSTPVPYKEPDDNPAPNPTDVGEEAKARIRALQAEFPRHLE